jgi:hypothetical protein
LELISLCTTLVSVPVSGEVAAGVIGGPDLVARATDGLECTALRDGNGCSVYLIRLRGEAVVGVDIFEQ